MKKSLFILAMLLCLAVLALPAMAEEPECLHDSVNCAGLCLNCYTTGHTSDNPVHLGAVDGTYYADGDTHYQLCECGAPINQEAHRVSCAEPDVCTNCGATGYAVTFHKYVGDFVPSSDGYNHSRTCACGEKTNTTMHRLYCDAPTTCTQCGATDCLSEYGAAHVNYVWTGDDATHWQECTCGIKSEVEPHHVYCTGNGVCTVCQATDCTSELVHTSTVISYNETIHYTDCGGCGARLSEGEHVDFYYSSDTYYHYKHCGECTYWIEKSEHSAPCNSDGTCSTCGTATTNLKHNWTHKNDDNYHWEVCNDCGADDWIDYGWREEHYAACDSDKTTCASCGLVTTNLVITHPWPTESGSDENYHYDKCTNCGENAWQMEHTALCNNPGKCCECDISVPLDKIMHFAETWCYDDKQHWLGCEVCSEPAPVSAGTKQDHYVTCQSLGACDICYMDPCPAPITHVGSADNAWYSDGENHWQLCECGEEINKNAHTVSCANPGVCTECGATDCTNEETHSVDCSQYVTDETHHWWGCYNCDNFQSSYAAHYNDCLHPDTCALCGADYVGTTPITHETTGVAYSYDDTYCWQVCPDCGEIVNKNAHAGECYDTKCGYCLTYAGDFPRTHSFSEESEVFHDETSHWQECWNCPERFNEAKHTVSCTNPGVCTECGATGCTNAVAHVSLSAYEYDDYSHWRSCSACGESETGYHEHTNVYQHDDSYCWENCPDCGMELSKFPHEAACINPGVCQRCGIDWDAEPQHAVLIDSLTYDENYCWYLCAYCGEEMEKIAHFIACSTPGVCNRCGAAASDSAAIIHSYDFETRKYDETYCWNECTDCGAQNNKWEHSVFCTNPGVCSECGAASSAEVHHFMYGTDPWYSEGDYHWQLCNECGEKVNYGTHSLLCDGSTNGLCFSCGITCTDDNPMHVGLFESTYDAENHFLACPSCDLQINKQAHTVSCTNPGVCTECGATGCTNEETHILVGNDWQTDDIYHWMNCSDCDESIEMAEHSFVENQRTETEILYVCDVCSAEKTESLHVHTYAESARKEASCGVKGEITFSCECGDSYTEEIPALTHSYTTTETPAACEVDGKKVTTCENCDDETIEVIPATGHKYSTTETPATCEADGKKVTTCANCDDETVEVIPAIGHKYSTVETPATCEVDGKKVTTCESCDDETIEVIPATGHKYSTTEAPATCEVDGKKVTSCENCDDETVEVIPAIGHKYSTVETPATCEVDGKKVTTCENCDDETVEVIPATGHKYTTVETPATCEVDGKKVTTCENCDDETVEVIPAIGHKYSTVETPATCLMEGKKVTTCENCGEVVTEILPIVDHNYEIISNVEAQCTTDGERVIECTICGKEIVNVTPATGHDFLLVSDTAPTCEADGEKLSACSVCGFELADITPAAGHNYGAYATKGDGTHVSECTVCGHERERACNYQNVTTNGITLTVCTVCGHTRFAHIAITPVVTPVPEVTETTEQTEAAETSEQTNTTEQTEATEQPAVTEEAETAVPDTLFVPVKVENVVVKSTKNEAEEVLPAGTQLVVYDQSAMLQEDSPILALYTIGLESDGYARTPEDSLRIELPLAEEQTAEDFVGYKLVVINMDGTMTEIEYKIEDGKIIFETDLVGIFAFLPIEE